MRLRASQVAALTLIVEEIVRDQQTCEQRLVPLDEAQQIADSFDAIKTVANELHDEIRVPNFPIGSASSRIDTIERLCNTAILAMHAHFEDGRKRPRA